MHTEDVRQCRQTVDHRRYDRRTFRLGSEQLEDGSGRYRRDHLRALAQRVEVADDEVRIMGSKSELLRKLVAVSSVETAVFVVQNSELKWRARKDSNL
jgi:site-specific DNA recombinase